jgi:hypothetical protein
MMPYTFCTWNAPGLPALQSRMACEPIGRETRTMCDSILYDVSTSDSGLETFTTDPVSSFFLVEDIQLAFCSIQEGIWTYREQQRNNSNNLMFGSPQHDILYQRLEFWKQKLDEVYLIHNTQDLLSTPMRFYHGIEDFSTPEWSSIVSNRPRSIYFDTVMLYHLLSLHLHIDVKSLQLLATQHVRNTNPEIEKGPLKEKLKPWTQLPSARTAIWHATEVLARRSEWQSEQNMSILDPINHMTVTVAALATWGYSYLGSQNCAICDPTFGSNGLPLDLLDPVTSGPTMNSWIASGGPVAFGEFTLCRCNLYGIIEIFRKYMPSGSNSWEIMSKYIFPDFRTMFERFRKPTMFERSHKPNDEKTVGR